MEELMPLINNEFEQVKIFHGDDRYNGPESPNGEEDLELDINRWLKENTNIKITHRQCATSHGGYVVGNDPYSWTNITIVIYYTCK